MSDPSGAKRIAADVTFLASPELAGRGTGEEGARLARDFVVKRFTDLGLTPAGSADGASFTQELTARVGADAKPPELAVVARGGASKSVDPLAARVADGSATGKVSAPAVFVGYGITAAAASWDDYAGVDLTGKNRGDPRRRALPSAPAPAPAAKGKPAATPAAPADTPARPALNPLRDFGAVRYKLRTAREHHAVGVVIVTRGLLPDAPSDASSMGIPGVVTTVDGVKALLPGLDLAGKATWEKGKPTKAKPLPVEIALGARIDPVEASTWNVAALLKGAARLEARGRVRRHRRPLRSPRPRRRTRARPPCAPSIRAPTTTPPGSRCCSSQRAASARSPRPGAQHPLHCLRRRGGRDDRLALLDRSPHRPARLRSPR